MTSFNPIQAALVLVLVFLSMAWNFGLVLMAIDRLRGEVADLAMSDDLTGVANRRHLLQRMVHECKQSETSDEPFSVLAIDLDGFKAINDSYGHGAGDECLRLLTRAVESRLRPGDLLARSGGDEFCVVLPETTLREGAMVARHVLEACRKELTPENGVSIAIAASIGVAQWMPQVGSYPERLLAAADQALYTAKNEGKNRYAVYQPPPPAADPIELRRTA
jgi:diguanylate cyclase (GGDEF)-like protein